MQIELESTRGGRQSLEAYRGHAVVVFYEAHGHTRDNEALKRACGAMVERGVDRLRVLGVANLRGLGAQPVRAFVRAAVTRVARRYGVELWMDFEGALQRAPLALGSESSVAVLAPNGALLFRADGAVADPRAFYAALDDALARAARAA